jgi:hypothetical protein
VNALDRFLGACDVRDGRTLIVGSKIHEGTDKPDRRTLYATALGVDMEAGRGVDRVLDLEEPLPDRFGDFDHIECTSVLEHSRRPWLMAANLERALVGGGTIIVLVPWVWRIHAYPSDYWRMTPAAVESIFPSIRWESRAYIVEGALVQKVPTITTDGTRYIARSELVMSGRKCASTS